MRSNTAKIALLLAFYLAWVVLLRLEASGDLLDTVLTIIGPIPLAVALLALDQRHIGPAGWLRKILPGLLPGAIAGLALWCGLRVGMRVVALAAGIPPSFSVSGTLEVLLIGLVLGASYGALLTAVWQSIAATRQAPGRWGWRRIGVVVLVPVLLGCGRESEWHGGRATDCPLYDVVVRDVDRVWLVARGIDAAFRFPASPLDMTYRRVR